MADRNPPGRDASPEGRNRRIPPQGSAPATPAGTKNCPQEPASRGAPR